MGIFANLTQIFYNGSFCNSSIRLFKQSEMECFIDPIECCNNMAGEQLVYEKCTNGTINYCTVPNQAQEDMGYILQLCGVLFLTLAGTMLIYGFCRFVCYREVENFDRDIERQKLLNQGL